MIKNIFFATLFCIGFISCKNSDQSIKESVIVDKKEIIQEPKDLHYTIEFRRRDGIWDSIYHDKLIGHWFINYVIELDSSKAVLEKFKDKRNIYNSGFFNPDDYKSITEKISILNQEKYDSLKYYVDSITSVNTKEIGAFRSHPAGYVVIILKNDSLYPFNLSIPSDTTTYRPIVYKFSDYLQNLQSKLEQDSL